MSPLKLIDFGLSRRLSYEGVARLTPKMGTAEYMSPEAFNGQIDLAFADRSDMWSLGVILHVMFVGHFPSPNLAEEGAVEDYLQMPFFGGISDLGLDLLGKLLEKEPGKRLTASAALAHPWLAQEALGAPVLHFAQKLPASVRSFAQAPGFRRLAFAAVVKQGGVSGGSLSLVRLLYQDLALVVVFVVVVLVVIVVVVSFVVVVVVVFVVVALSGLGLV
ncbi:unnamed protein product [Polarella glacialis]|uniref:Protein kinase domain-containing protein n=1 Tax=Polarella glacialis TaxID=89957 RepID=A0A813E3F7_POLGL|nr:unnamed protein product [Polarella glacialis]